LRRLHTTSTIITKRTIIVPTTPRITSPASKRSGAALLTWRRKRLISFGELA
jgi:hypothetical protein